MSNTFLKIFHLCFTNLKSIQESSILQLPPQSKQHENETTLKNFNNSLYDLSSSALTPSTRTTTTTTTTTASDDFHSPESDFYDPSPPDFATILSSQRFFFSSPGRSNSIVESSSSSSSLEAETETETEAEAETDIETPQPVDGGVAVKKYSPDPYKDFRVSMQEMIEARNLTDVNKNWDFLHELLVCYLTLNPKNTHKFILSAFADIVVCLLSSSSSPESDRPESHRR